jgi:non-ribosomal peptide synthetase component E (peptide arylation enzyme)
MFEEELTMKGCDLIKPHVVANLNKTAIFFGERRFSYAELDALVSRMASGLLKIGLKSGVEWDNISRQGGERNGLCIY